MLRTYSGRGYVSSHITMAVSNSERRKMTNPFAVGMAEIRQLDAGQLQSLLAILLHLDAAANGIALSAVHATDHTRISVPDGGEDGRIEWTIGPERTDW